MVADEEGRILALGCLAGTEACLLGLQGRLTILAKDMVPGGTRYDANDVAAEVFGELLTSRRGSLEHVAAGKWTLDAVLKNLLRHANSDLAQFHGRAKRAHHMGISLEADADGLRPIEPVALPADPPIAEMDWPALLATEFVVRYREGLDWIHRDGPDWGRTAPYYAFALLDERCVWRRSLIAMNMADAPKDPAATIVTWSPSVGSLGLSNGLSLDEVWGRCSADRACDDHAVALILGHTNVTLIQQWRHRANDRLLAGKPLAWLQERFRHRKWSRRHS